MCLGQEDAADLRAPRASSDNAIVSEAIEEAISRKPKGHDFIIDRRQQRPGVERHMSVTGRLMQSPQFTFSSLAGSSCGLPRVGPAW